MKRKGLTLIELIVSLALLSIILMSTVTIFGRTSLNIGRNGVDINSVNLAKSEVDFALNNPEYTGTNNQVENNLTTISVLGTDVPVRYISSPMTNDADIKFFVYTMEEGSVVDPDGGDGGDPPPVISPNETPVYLDNNNNRVFDEGTDEYLDVDSLGNFRYTGSADLIVDGYAEVEGDISVKTKNDFVIMPDGKLTSGGEIDLTADNVYIESGGELANTTGDLYIKTGNIDMKDGAQIYSPNDIDIQSKDQGGRLTDITLVNNSQIKSEKNSTIKCGNVDLDSSSKLLVGQELSLDCIDVSLNDGSEINANEGNIKSSGNIVVNNYSKIGSNLEGLDISCKELIVDNYSKVATYAGNGNISIITSVEVNVLNGSDISCQNGDVYIKSVNMKLENGSEINLYTEQNILTINLSEDLLVINSKINVLNGKIDIDARNMALDKGYLYNNSSTSDKIIDIDINNDVVVTNMSIIGFENATLDVKCVNFEISNSSEIKSGNNTEYPKVVINATDSFKIYSSEMSIGSSILIMTENAYIAGTPQKHTKFYSFEDTEFDVKKGMIYYGIEGQSSAYLDISGGSKNGYLFNSGGADYSTYLEPTTDGKYFK